MATTDNDLDFTNWKPPPDPPPTPTVVAGGPQRRIIASRQEFSAAFDEIFAKTKHNLRIFDSTLADFGMNSAAREAQLRALLLRRRANRLMIVVHDTTLISRRSARLMRLVREFSHSITIHQTNDEIRNLEDVLVIGDDKHCLRRRNFSHPRGAVYLDDPVETREWLNRFNSP